MHVTQRTNQLEGSEHVCDNFVATPFCAMHLSRFAFLQQVESVYKFEKRVAHTCLQCRDCFEVPVL